MELTESIDRIEATGTRVLAISVDDLQGADYAVQAFGAGFPVLYTSGAREIPEAYGVWNLHRDNLAAPSLFQIDTTGELIWQHVEPGPYHRLDTERILEVLEQNLS